MQAVDNQYIIYSLHRGRSRRALVRVLSDCCGLYRVEWPGLGLSDLANLTRCKAAAREWVERLEQRSIVIEMQRRLPGESLAELRVDRSEQLDNLARMCCELSPNLGDGWGQAAAV